jgi:hypothetical protein
MSKNEDSNLPVPLGSGLSAAASKLADTIRHVIDLAAGPDRLLKKEKALANARVEHAQAAALVHEIEARTVERIKKREIRRQENIESISGETAKFLPPPDELSSEPVNEDWTTRFFEECQDISDAQMQKIWARILAGEIARPQTFSVRTLRLVKDLTSKDADLFSKLCRFVWEVEGGDIVPIIFDLNDEPVKRSQLTFSVLTHLTSIGLIEFNGIGGFAVNPDDEKSTVRVSFNGVKYKLTRGPYSESLPIGKVLFTASGAELAKIAGGSPIDEVRESTLQRWLDASWSAELISS